MNVDNNMAIINMNIAGSIDKTVDKIFSDFFFFVFRQCMADLLLFLFCFVLLPVTSSSVFQDAEEFDWKQTVG